MSLPARLGPLAQQALADPALLSLRDEVSVIEARTQQVLGSLERDPRPAWSVALAQLDDIDEAFRDGVTSAVGPMLDALRTTIQAGLDEGRVWQQVLGLIDQRRKLVESERRRLVELQQVLTAEQAIAFVSTLQDVVVRHVRDRAVLGAIADEFQRVLVVGPQQGESRGGE